MRPSLLLFLVLDGTEVAGIVPVTATHGATSATGTVVALDSQMLDEEQILWVLSQAWIFIRL